MRSTFRLQRGGEDPTKGANVINYHHTLSTQSVNEHIFVYEWGGTGERSTGEIRTNHNVLYQPHAFLVMKEMDSSPVLCIFVGRVLLIKMGRASRRDEIEVLVFLVDCPCSISRIRIVCFGID